MHVCEDSSREEGNQRICRTVARGGAGGGGGGVPLHFFSSRGKNTQE